MDGVRGGRSWRFTCVLGGCRVIVREGFRLTRPAPLPHRSSVSGQVRRGGCFGTLHCIAWRSVVELNSSQSSLLHVLYAPVTTSLLDSDFGGSTTRSCLLSRRDWCRGGTRSIYSTPADPWMTCLTPAPSRVLHPGRLVTALRCSRAGSAEPRRPLVSRRWKRQAILPSLA